MAVGSDAIRVATLIDRAVCGEWPSGDRHTSAQKVQKVYLRYITLASSGVAYPSQETLAQELGMNRRDVRNSIKLLEAAGFLLRQGDHVVGKHGTVFRPVVKERCRVELADPEVIFGDEVCGCLACSGTGGNSGGDSGGNSGGCIGGHSPATSVRGKSDEESEHSTTFQSGGESTAHQTGFSSEMMRVAREAIRVVARDNCSAEDGVSTFSRVRDTLDEQLFWRAVEEANSLRGRGIPEANVFEEVHAWVEDAAMSVGLI